MAVAPASAASAMAVLTAAASAPSSRAAATRLERRHQRIEHGLLAGRGLAQRLDADDGRIDGGHDGGAGPGRGIGGRDRPPGPHEGGPVEWARRPADRADERASTGPQPRSGDGERAVALGHAGIERGHDRGEPAIHVGAVVAVADRLVQGGQGRRRVVQSGGREPQPGIDDVDHHVGTSTLGVRRSLVGRRSDRVEVRPPSPWGSGSGGRGTNGAARRDGGPVRPPSGARPCGRVRPSSR